MPDQRGFGNHGTDSPRPCQSDHRDDHMNHTEYLLSDNTSKCLLALLVRRSPMILEAVLRVSNAPEARTF